MNTFAFCQKFSCRVSLIHQKNSIKIRLNNRSPSDRAINSFLTKSRPIWDFLE